MSHENNDSKRAKFAPDERSSDAPRETTDYAAELDRVPNS
jgi:hypothetical protein